MISWAAFAGSILLAGTFVWSGVAKATRPERWRLDLQTYKLPRAVKALAFLGLPWAELGVAAVLVLEEAWGAGFALGLASLFCLAIVRARLMQEGNMLNCGCFGGRRLRDYRLLLLRNGLIGSLAGFIVWGASTPSDPRGAIGDRAPFLLPAVLLVIAIVATVWTAWQIGAYLRPDRSAG